MLSLLMFLAIISFHGYDFFGHECVRVWGSVSVVPIYIYISILVVYFLSCLIVWVLSVVQIMKGKRMCCVYDCLVDDDYYCVVPCTIYIFIYICISINPETWNGKQDQFYHCVVALLIIIGRRCRSHQHFRYRILKEFNAVDVDDDVHSDLCLYVDVHTDIRRRTTSAPPIWHCMWYRCQFSYKLAPILIHLMGGGEGNGMNGSNSLFDISISFWQ